jgi:twitching motility protein PilT
MNATEARDLLDSLLAAMLEQQASDLHLAAGAPPMLRIDGKLCPVDVPPLSAETTEQMAGCMLNAKQQQRLTLGAEVDLSFAYANRCRLRANVYRQRGSVSIALRVIPVNIRSFEELGLPKVLGDIARKPRGLVLITGPVGSGKSTTLAALLDLINKERQGHIVTIEDPIEFVHQNQNCIINQREVGTDTESFATALKYVLRQDPDVVFIGEMRDLETIEAALTISETGRLALATLHTNSTAQTINRIIDVFPENKQAQVRSQLSLTLQAVVCQTLLPKIRGGRAMAMEILTLTPAVRNLIRDDKIYQIYSALQTGRGKSGMQTLNHSLADLVLQRWVAAEVALLASSDPDELQQMLAAAGKGTR